MAVAYVLQPRVTVEFQEEPSADMLDAISVRLWRYQARSLHLAVSWLPAKWDDPRHVPELAKALTPSLEAFIFDVRWNGNPTTPWATSVMCSRRARI